MTGPFRIIVADPPYAFDDTLPTGDDKPKRGAAQQYPTLDIEELKRLPVEHLAEEDAILTLWCPAALLADGLALMRAWGFTYKQLWTWVKTKANTEGLPLDPGSLAFGMGRLARNCSEYVLVGTRGSVTKHLQTRSERNVLFAPAMPHSAKPECVQDQLDRMFPDGKRLELFARRDRAGDPRWTCTGNECPRTMGEDVRDAVERLAPQKTMFGHGAR